MLSIHARALLPFLRSWRGFRFGGAHRRRAGRCAGLSHIGDGRLYGEDKTRLCVIG